MSEEIKVIHEHDDRKGSFIVIKDGKESGYMSYVMMNPNIMDIEHTEVAPELKGKGAGKKLIAEGILYARNNNLKIRPTCGYVKHIMEKDESLKDVIYVE